MNKLEQFLDWLVAFLTPKPPTPPTEPLAPITPPPSAPPLPPPGVRVPLLEAFCQEIKKMEGWGPGTTSFANNNPGNLRCQYGMPATWNVLALHATPNNFCVFASADAGMQALRNVTTKQCKGESPTYNAAARALGLTSSAELNLYQYFVIRDPASDANDPNALAVRFGKALGVDPATFKIKQLLV